MRVYVYKYFSSMYVCVCEREREREDLCNKSQLGPLIRFNRLVLSEGIYINILPLCVCVCVGGCIYEYILRACACVCACVGEYSWDIISDSIDWYMVRVCMTYFSRACVCERERESM